MSVKNAQQITNELAANLGFAITAYSNSDLELLKSKLEEFLALGIDTEELQDPDLLLDEDESDDADVPWESDEE